MRLSLVAVLTAVVPVVMACSTPTENPTASTRVDGSWVDPNEFNPSGYCFHFQLHVEGTVVTGSGLFCDMGERLRASR